MFFLNTFVLSYPWRNIIHCQCPIIPHFFSSSSSVLAHRIPLPIAAFGPNASSLSLPDHDAAVPNETTHARKHEGGVNADERGLSLSFAYLRSHSFVPTLSLSLFLLYVYIYIHIYTQSYIYMYMYRYIYI